MPLASKLVGTLSLQELEKEIPRYEKGIPTMAADDPRREAATVRLKAMQQRRADFAAHQKGTSVASPGSSAC